LEEENPMLKLISAVILVLLSFTAIAAQSTQTGEAAANPVQASQLVADASLPSQAVREVKIPAGTPIDIEVTHLVSSMDAKPGDLLSFRVLVPIKIDDAIVIPAKALVTARLVKAKRAGHWGKAGKLVWTMQDVVAVDLSRVALMANPDFPNGQQGVTGQSHGAEVATKTAVMGALLAPTVVLAPLALMQGFKRGEQAVLPEGKRFVVYVLKETIVHVSTEQKPGQ
jgi:hypothetical protein